MRKPLLAAVLSLFLQVPTLISSAQKVSISGNVYEKGTVKNSFKTPHGAITVILPDDMRPGDVISGTVQYEPEGKKEKDKNKNRIELLKYALSVEPRNEKGPKTILVEPIKDPQATMHGGAEATQDVFVTEFTIPANYADNNLHLVFRDAQKNIIAESSNPVIDIPIPDLSAYTVKGRFWGDISNSQTQPQQPARIFIPDKTVYMAGELAVINSAAEAHKSGTLVYLNRTRQKELSALPSLELKTLARSPRKIVIQLPDNIYGPVELEIQDTKKQAAEKVKIHMILLQARADKLSLRKGESTLLHVNVLGFKDCPADYLRLTLNNTTVSSVQMGRANREELVIEPVNMKYSSIGLDYAVQKEKKESDTKEKNWEKTEGTEFSLQRNITAKQTGNFNIDIALSYPESVYSDPFRQQLDALKTPEQLKSWFLALATDLSGSNTINRDKLNDHFVTITGRDLEQAKYKLSNWSGSKDFGRVKVKFPNSTLEAGKAAVENALNEKGTEPVHYEVIELALQAARQQAQSSGDKQLANNADSLKKKLLTLQREMNEFSERAKIFEDILKTFNDAIRSVTSNIRASVDKSNTNREFKNALITEISFPKMDAISKGNVPVMSVYYPRKGSILNNQQEQKNWSVNSFRFEMDGLPCKKISKVESFTIKQGVKPVNYSITDNQLQITISEEDLKAWQDWYRSLSEKNGSIEYFDETNRSLVSLDILNVKAVNITPAANGSFNFILQPADIKFSYNPVVLFNLHSSHYVANEIAGQPCNPEGASTFTWLYIEKPCRIEIATTRASNIDPDDEEALSKIEDLFGEVSEDGADLGKKLSKAFSITKSFAIWVRVVRDWESYKAEYVCRNGAWQHGEMTLVNSGQKVLYGWELFRGESGNDTWHGGDDMSWIMKQAEDIKNKVCK